MDLNSIRYFAVIDTETNFDNDVISIGAVIADSDSFRPIDRIYLIIDPEYRQPSMFGNVLRHQRAAVDAVVSRKEAVSRLSRLLMDYGVTALFAYNAAFDKGHLPEFSEYHWFDIMRLASYRQYNGSIPDSCECCKTGKMKCGYGAEQIYKMLSDNDRYEEIHNALTDAEDELEIMRMLGHKAGVYEIAEI